MSMKKLLGVLTFLLLVLLIQSCNEDHKTVDGLEGRWEIVATSGGVSGGGYIPKFKTLEIDEDSSFKMKDNLDLLIAKGHIEEIEHQFFEYAIRFVAEEVNVSGYVDLLDDSEKGVEFEENKLRLRSGNLDGFDTELGRLW